MRRSRATARERNDARSWATFDAGEPESRGSRCRGCTNRARQHVWSTAPSRWLLLSSAVDLLIACTLANRGVAMAPLPLVVIAVTLAASVGFAFLVDLIKVPVFRRLQIA